MTSFNVKSRDTDPLL